MTFLIRNGYSHVDKYHDGESFLESLDRFDERAVVLDFDLSGGGDLNGLEVLEASRSAAPAPMSFFFSGQDSLGSGCGVSQEWCRRLHRQVQRRLCIGQDVVGQGL